VSGLNVIVNLMLSKGKIAIGKLGEPGGITVYLNEVVSIPPIKLNVEIFKVSLPLLFIVKILCEESPTATLPKLNEDESTDIRGLIIPEPVNVILSGDPAALCTILIVAFFAPALVGKNLSVTVVIPEGAIDEEARVYLNEVVSIPPLVKLNDEIFKVSLPVFVIVAILCAVSPTITSPKLNETVSIDMIGAIAVPNNLTILGDPDALCTILNVSLFAPKVVGLNVIVNLVLSKGKTVIGKGEEVLEVYLNEPVSTPAKLNESIVKFAVPLFVIVKILCKESPTLTIPKLPKLNDAVSIDITGLTVPVPVNVILLGDPSALCPILIVAFFGGPALVGLNISVNLVLSEGKTVNGKLLYLNEVVSVPPLVKLNDEIFKVSLPTFFIVAILCEESPTATLPKLNEGVSIDIIGFNPVPVNVTRLSESPAL